MGDTEVRQDTNTFEIGLVLAGAVSAGAYSAGVIDFLIEAVDRWYAAKESEASRGIPREQWQVPPHDIRLKAISGSSAGSMVAALAAVALNEAPCAINPSHLPEKSDNTNKLYSSWVIEADIARMLTTADLEKKNKPLSSLLDSSFLQKLAEETMIIRQPVRPRTYVPDALALFICVTNLRGVPYSIDFQGPKVVEQEPKVVEQGKMVFEHWMSNHADYLRFDVVKSEAGQNSGSDPTSIFLHPTPQNEKEKAAWKKLAQAAVASGAFPLALAPQVIKRGAGDYNERQWAIPSAEPSPSGGTQVCSDWEKIPPDWDGNAPDDYFFLAVDGGVMNNEPLEYARQEIAGAQQHSSRDSDKATRAMVMIDPFPDAVPVTADYQADTGLFSVVSAIFKSLMSQAKFKIDELKLARDPDVFSRFVITPTRDKTARESQKEKWPALASNSLFHFGGFFNEDFRRHDFLLGRRNCQRFLQKYFILSVDNKLFDQWPPHLKQAGSPYLQKVTVEKRDSYYLPIIPLVGDLNSETREPQPPWPEMPAKEFAKLKKGLSVRTRLVLNQMVSGLIGSRAKSNSLLSGWKSILLRAGLFILKLLVRPILGWLAGWLTGKLIKKMQENLAADELLKKER